MKRQAETSPVIRERKKALRATEGVRRYADQIQRYVARRVGADAADDVVAETFLLAFRQRERYDMSSACARPWLYGIATNLIGRYRRAEIRQYRALARIGIDPVAESFADRVDEAVSAGALNRRLAAALAALPASHRDTLLLVAWGGLSHQEAAAALRVYEIHLPERTGLAPRLHGLALRRMLASHGFWPNCEPTDAGGDSLTTI